MGHMRGHMIIEMRSKMNFEGLLLTRITLYLRDIHMLKIFMLIISSVGNFHVLNFHGTKVPTI